MGCKLLRIDIDVGSLLKQPLVLDELVIDSPIANMEIDESGGSNLKDILDNVSKNSAKADEKAAEKRVMEAISEKADGLLKSIGGALGKPAEEGASTAPQSGQGPTPDSEPPVPLAPGGTLPP